MMRLQYIVLWIFLITQIESVNQMRIVADGYIQSLQEANQSLGQCVDGLIDEVDRIQAVNEEILRTAEAMAKISRNLE